MAKRQAVTNPTNTLFAIKRLIGRNFSDPVVAKDKDMVPYEIVKGPTGDAWVRAHGKDYSPQRDLGLHPAVAMKEDAEAHLGEKVEKGGDHRPGLLQRRPAPTTKDAGKIAGLEVLRIINEPALRGVPWPTAWRRMTAEEDRRSMTSAAGAPSTFRSWRSATGSSR